MFVVGIYSVVVVVQQLVSLEARRSTVPAHLAQSTQTTKQVTRTTNNHIQSLDIYLIKLREGLGGIHVELIVNQPLPPVLKRIA